MRIFMIDVAKTIQHSIIVGVLVTIEQLRRLAELNLCPDCFRRYKIIIEPSIVLYLSQPLYDWRIAESQITQVVMKTKGIFKSDITVLLIDEGDEEDVSSEVDVKEFRKIEKMSFKSKIKYLHDNGIIQNSSYIILDKARGARNKIHAEPNLVELSSEDYALFSMASWISNTIWISVLDRSEKIATQIRSNTEKAAELWLKKQAK